MTVNKENEIIKQTYERIKEVVSNDVLVELEYGYGYEYGYGEIQNIATFNFTFGDFHFIKIIREGDINYYINHYSHTVNGIYKVLAMDILESFKSDIINKIFNINEMYRYDNPF